MAAVIGTYALAGFAGWISGEPMKPYTWLGYLFFATIYTLTIYIGSPDPKSVALIFTRKNTRKRSIIIGVHSLFLATYLGVVWTACKNLALMPAWLTVRGFMMPTRHSFQRVSLLEIFFLLLLVILWRIEMPCVYAEAKTPRTGTFENPSAPRWMNPPGD
ncbi:MAG: hypothetical protein WAL45_14605 [Terracidiphilus sp.]